MNASKKSSPFLLLHLNPSHRGQTVLTALRSLLPESSWGQVRRQVESRHLQINGNLCCDPARKLQGNEVLKWWREALPKPVEPKDLKIPYLDSHLLVVEKPAGITSVRHFEERDLPARRRQLQPTLEELLPLALQLRLSGTTSSRPGSPPGNRPPRDRRKSGPPSRSQLPRVIAVHRLDRDTSGLMLFARTQQAQRALEELFRHHRVDRRYRAVIHGQIASQTIQSVLVRDRGDGVRGSGSPEDPSAQHAITHVKPVETFRGGQYSMVECQLETGRTHQIRIHLAEAGHRICGEPIYNRPLHGKPMEDLSGAPRQALHSYSLRLVHPFTSQTLEFSMPWPRDLDRWIRRLRTGELGKPSDESIG